MEYDTELAKKNARDKKIKTIVFTILGTGILLALVLRYA